MGYGAVNFHHNFLPSLDLDIEKKMSKILNTVTMYKLPLTAHPTLHVSNGEVKP